MKIFITLFLTIFIICNCAFSFTVDKSFNVKTKEIYNRYIKYTHHNDEKTGFLSFDKWKQNNDSLLKTYERCQSRSHTNFKKYYKCFSDRAIKLAKKFPKDDFFKLTSQIIEYDLINSVVRRCKSKARVCLLRDLKHNIKGTNIKQSALNSLYNKAVSVQEESRCQSKAKNEFEFTRCSKKQESTNRFASGQYCSHESPEGYIICGDRVYKRNVSLESSGRKVKAIINQIPEHGQLPKKSSSVNNK